MAVSSKECVRISLIGAALASNGLPIARWCWVQLPSYALRHMTMLQGQFGLQRIRHHGSRDWLQIKQAFGVENAVGSWLHLGDRRFRVIGILSSQGTAMGMNTDELVIIPVASAHMLFNTQNLLRILVEAKSREEIERARKETEEILFKQHGGERDVTVVTQDAMVATFDRILRTLTMAVGGIAAISLAVAGVLIMNVMLIAVSQHAGNRPAQGLVRRLRRYAGYFCRSSTALSLVGSVVGLLLGQLGSFVIGKYIRPASDSALVGNSRCIQYCTNQRYSVQRLAGATCRTA
jgi:putative ABC transport system permease protein